MSEQWEAFEAVTAESVAEQLDENNGKGLDFLGTVMRDGLPPYVKPLWLNKKERVCRARSIPAEDRAMVAHKVDVNWCEEHDTGSVDFYMFGDDTGHTAGGTYCITEIVFKRSDVDTFFNPPGMEKAKSATTANDKTTAANEALDRSTADRWAGHLSTAVKMAFEMALAPGKEYTSRELGKMAASYGSEWIGKNDRPCTPLEVFKKAIPTSYRKGPGAPTQSED